MANFLENTSFLWSIKYKIGKIRQKYCNWFDICL